MNENPHICLVSDTLHSYFGSDLKSATGGAERQQHLLSMALRDREYDISVATLSHTDEQHTTIDGINIWRVIPDVRGIARAPYKALETIRALQKIDADIYYVRGNDFLCMVTAAYTRLSDATFVYAVANDANVDPELLEELGILKYPFMWAMRSADCVVAQTEHQRELLQTGHGIDAPVIPNGYEMPDESTLASHTERNHVLWVGSIDPDQKKPKRYLDLARQLPQTEFILIGPPDNDNPEYYNEIKTEASEIPNVEFLGYVDPDEIHDYYKQAIALVNTSDYEGFPNVFLEAWRYATPVVSLHHSLDGIIDSEPVGIHAGSMEALVEAVSRLSTDVALRKELGDGGREYMSEHYSFDHLISKYEAVFQSLTQHESA